MIIGRSENPIRTAAQGTGKKLGKTDDLNTVISASVPGNLTKVVVKVGDVVQDGQLLFSIDPTPFQLSLDDASSDFAQAQVHLSADRDKFRSISEAAAANQVSRADYDAARNAIQSSEATLEKTRTRQLQAKFQLAQSSGRAPTCSRVTALLVNPGSRVEIGTPVVSLSPGCE
jgi:multidrug efflux system membrane fusion protein